jgi:hypothetical protein
VSLAVSPEAVCQKILELGPAAYLFTVTGEGQSHVVSVSVRGEGGRLSMRVGRRSSGNLVARPTLTLLWPARPGDEYSLLVDGHVVAAPDPAGGLVEVQPTSAVWHRAADGTGPTCLPIDDR